MSESFKQEYRDRVDGAIEMVTRKMVRGGAKDYQEYLAMVHEIKAYERSRDMFQRSIDHYFRDEDENDSQGEADE